jgi:hypothetical protein
VALATIVVGFTPSPTEPLPSRAQHVPSPERILYFSQTVPCTPDTVVRNHLIQCCFLLRHLNTTFLGIDGCFKTKLKDRGIKDPDLGNGLAYMVDDTDYTAHLKDPAGLKADEEKVIYLYFRPVLVRPNTYHPSKTTSCGSDLHAVNQAYTRNSKGYLVTGVVAVSCRHAFVRPTGVVDLQKGEK